MEDNFSLSSTLPMDDEIYDEIYDEEYYDFWRSHFEWTVIVSFICVVCIFGLVGNGIVIWLLGFRMKRNSITTYILNLAVADFGVLISSIPIAVLSIVFVLVSSGISPTYYLYIMMRVLFYFAYSTSQFLLTAISIDRCVCVLFPLWYRCNRPEKLSTILCALIWIFCFLVHGICVTLHFLGDEFIVFYAFLVNAVVCLPLITVSTLILFIRFCFKSQQRQWKKLFMAILLALFFFLIFAFPLNIIFLIHYISMIDSDIQIILSYYYIIECGWLCASLNSFVNPLLYFLVGRKKRGLCKENMKLILRRVFSEEEEEEEEEETRR